MTWVERLRRVFQIDINTCPDYGGRLRWIAKVTDPRVVRKILLRVRLRVPPRGGAEGHEPSHADTPFALAG